MKKVLQKLQLCIGRQNQNQFYMYCTRENPNKNFLIKVKLHTFLNAIFIKSSCVNLNSHFNFLAKLQIIFSSSYRGLHSISFTKLLTTFRVTFQLDVCSIKRKCFVYGNIKNTFYKCIIIII